MRYDLHISYLPEIDKWNLEGTVFDGVEYKEFPTSPLYFATEEEAEAFKVILEKNGEQ